MFHPVATSIIQLSGQTKKRIPESRGGQSMIRDRTDAGTGANRC